MYTLYIYIYIYVLLLHPFSSLCALTGVSNSFKLAVIKEMYIPIAIFLIALGLFCEFLFFPSSFASFSCASHLEMSL